MILGLAALAGPRAQAGIVVDQSQLSNPNYMASFSQDDLAQSFQQSHSNITGAQVQLIAGIGDGGPGDITIQLYDALPNAGGTLLASGTDTGVLAGEFATVSFGLVAIAPDTTYYLVFTSTNRSLGLNGDVNNPYSRGQVYANPGYGSFPDYDYTFQTFADDGVNSVPEPSTFALAGLAGLGGLVAAARRRRATA